MGEGELAMPKMTPEQEAAYAIDFNVARKDLSRNASGFRAKRLKTGSVSGCAV